MSAHSEPGRSLIQVAAPSRRAVVGAAVWGAPAVVVASAVPAFASSRSVITADYNGDSFRANTNAQLAAGTPVAAGQFAAVAMTVSVTDGGVQALRCTITTAGNVGIPLGTNGRTVGAASSNADPGNPPTTWQANNASLAADGWVVTGATVGSSFILDRAVPTALVTSTDLRIVFDAVGGDLPFNFVFSAAETPSTATLQVASSPVSPFLVQGGV